MNTNNIFLSLAVIAGIILSSNAGCNSNNEPTLCDMGEDNYINVLDEDTWVSDKATDKASINEGSHQLYQVIFDRSAYVTGIGNATVTTGKGYYFFVYGKLNSDGSYKLPFSGEGSAQQVWEDIVNASNGDRDAEIDAISSWRNSLGQEDYIVVDAYTCKGSFIKRFVQEGNNGFNTYNNGAPEHVNAVVDEIDMYYLDNPAAVIYPGTMSFNTNY